jgi:hypothetical protein
MKAVRRGPTAGREHEFEPQRGLPELLPADETLLWQGSPEWRSLALRAFHLRKLALYFAALLLLRGSFALADSGNALVALRSVAILAPLAIIALGLVALLAWLSARTAVYTITTRRVVMRVGIVLTMTYNLPFKRIVGAGLLAHKDGSGDLPLQLKSGDRIALLHLWPHSRPWHFAQPEPMLRCIPQAAVAARQLAQAWAQATGQSATPEAREPAALRPQAAPGQPALAGH